MWEVECRSVIKQARHRRNKNENMPSMEDSLCAWAAWAIETLRYKTQIRTFSLLSHGASHFTRSLPPLPLVIITEVLLKILVDTVIDNLNIEQ